MRPDDRNAMSMETLLKDFVRSSGRLILQVLVVSLMAPFGVGQTTPTVNTVFPSGGQSGTTFEVSITGTQVDSAAKLQSNIPGFESELLSPNRFRLTLPDATPSGTYDIWAVGADGVSNPRTFLVGGHPELMEVEPNDVDSAAMSVIVNRVINGQLDKSGDVDCYQFQATRGQRIIIECSAERIDSRLRAVLEVFDVSGRRVAVNRGYFGVDPLIDFVAPSDGKYFVRVQDLISSGGAEFYYRLEFDTQPRVVFARPAVIQQGQAARVTLFGWNLSGAGLPTSLKSGEISGVTDQQSGQDAANESLRNAHHSGGGLEQLEIEIPATLAQPSKQIPVPLLPSQAVTTRNAFAFHLEGGNAPVMIGLTDLPVSLDLSNNHSPDFAQPIQVPSEVSGELTDASEQDWFAMDVQRGEVLHLAAFGQRISSPVDLQISVYDSEEHLLVQFNDEPKNPGGEFNTSHLDPAGRWVCPRNGRYFFVLRNLNRGVSSDLRRIYQFSVRREEADFQVVAIPSIDGVKAMNIPQGGRQLLKLLAVRERGYDGTIRVTAKSLPGGIECPDIWFGPGVNHATMVISADQAG
ncbi:MAG: PPC domain-containing protein [Planctomycetaceae bacterium]